LVAYNFRIIDSSGLAIPDHEMLKQAERLSTSEDFSSSFSTDKLAMIPEEESKEESFISQIQPSEKL